MLIALQPMRNTKHIWIIPKYLILLSETFLSGIPYCTPRSSQWNAKWCNHFHHFVVHLIYSCLNKPRQYMTSTDIYTLYPTAIHNMSIFWGNIWSLSDPTLPDHIRHNMINSTSTWFPCNGFQPSWFRFVETDWYAWATRDLCKMTYRYFKFPLFLIINCNRKIHRQTSTGF